MRQVATSIMDGVVDVTERLVGGADGATNASTGPPAFLYDFVLREGTSGEVGWGGVGRERESGDGAPALFSPFSFTHTTTTTTGGAYWYHR